MRFTCSSNLVCLCAFRFTKAFRREPRLTVLSLFRGLITISSDKGSLHSRPLCHGASLHIGLRQNGPVTPGGRGAILMRSRSRCARVSSNGGGGTGFTHNFHRRVSSRRICSKDRIQIRAHDTHIARSDLKFAKLTHTRLSIREKIPSQIFNIGCAHFQKYWRNIEGLRVSDTPGACKDQV